MPSHSLCLQLKTTQIIINRINHQFKQSPSNPPIKFPISQHPFQSISSLLIKCQTKSHLCQVHAHMTTTGLIHHLPLASKLIASFARNTLFPDTTPIAHSIACRIEGLDTYTWNTIINGYLEGNDYFEAISVYNCLRMKSLKIDSYTVLYVVKACGFMPFIDLSLQVHCLICKLGFVAQMIIQTAVMKMYGLFSDYCSVQQLFDEMPDKDVIAWNALVSVYAQHKNGYGYKALDVIRVMIRDGARPNGITAVGVLSACFSLSYLNEGKSVHGYAVKNLSDIDVFVYNALIDMYSKCGSLSYARKIFYRMPMRNLVSWTSMINGLSNNNYPDEALTLFKEMEGENVKPDEITILAVISMCSKLGNFELAEWIDHYVEEKSFTRKGNNVANAMIDMHAKCGNIEKACQVFDEIFDKTLVSWSSMIQGLAMHGHGIASLVRFSQMQREGLKPDGVVFLSVLSACSHSGLVDEARKCFSAMKNDYLIEPWKEHYGCMVDLLCRNGLLDEAFEIVQNMPIEPDSITRRMLMGACQAQRNISLACKITNHFHKLGFKNSQDYVSLSNLYATVDDWGSVKEVRDQMRENGVTNQDPGCSVIGMS